VLADEDGVFFLQGGQHRGLRLQLRGFHLAALGCDSTNFRLFGAHKAFLELREDEPLRLGRDEGLLIDFILKQVLKLHLRHLLRFLGRLVFFWRCHSE